MKKINILYVVVIFLVRLMFRLFYKHRIYGLEHYPRGSGIIAANHLSFLDPPAIAISCPEPIHFFARSSLFTFPLGPLIKRLHAHPVGGQRARRNTLRVVEQVFKDGEKILIFPEGTRSVDGKLLPLKSGIGRLTEKTDFPIIPAYISGTGKIWSRNQKLPKPFGQVTVVFGRPISRHSFGEVDRKTGEQLLLEKLTEQFTQLKIWVETGCKGSPP